MREVGFISGCMHVIGGEKKDVGTYRLKIEQYEVIYIYTSSAMKGIKKTHNCDEPHNV